MKHRIGGKGMKVCPVCHGDGFFHVKRPVRGPGSRSDTFRYCDCEANIAERRKAKKKRSCP